jgi:hypothetical protein
MFSKAFCVPDDDQGCLGSGQAYAEAVDTAHETNYALLIATSQ